MEITHVALSRLASVCLFTLLLTFGLNAVAQQLQRELVIERSSTNANTQDCPEAGQLRKNVHQLMAEFSDSKQESPNWSRIAWPQQSRNS